VPTLFLLGVFQCNVLPVRRYLTFLNDLYSRVIGLSTSLPLRLPLPGLWCRTIHPPISARKVSNLFFSRGSCEQLTLEHDSG